MVQKATIKTKK